MHVLAGDQKMTHLGDVCYALTRLGYSEMPKCRTLGGVSSSTLADSTPWISPWHTLVEQCHLLLIPKAALVSPRFGRPDRI